MNPVVVRSLIGVGLAGVSVAGGYGIYSNLTAPKTLGDLLKSKGLNLLDVTGDTDDAEWDKNVSEHKSNSSRIPKLTGYQEDTNSANDDNKKKENNRNSMKGICKSMFGLSSSESSKFEEAKQWCTKTSKK